MQARSLGLSQYEQTSEARDSNLFLQTTHDDNYIPVIILPAGGSDQVFARVFLEGGES
jgi:hypothetical protein